MIELFTWLSNALLHTWWVACIAAFGWGVLSIVLSPCHLASIPLIIGFIGNQGIIGAKRAFVVSLSFALGILVTIALVGAATGLAGRMLGDVGKTGTIIVSIFFVVIGLYLLDIIPLPLLNTAVNPQMEKKGTIAAFLLGLIFGIALGPCTFAYMAPMLGVVFTVAHTQFLFALILVIMYALGHCAVIVIAGTSFELVEKYLQWNEHSKAIVIVKKICGMLVICAGIYLVVSIL
ncbi:MAG: cytochrome c biogenesis CcdA family protein [Spirochaetota bacterium]